MIKLKNYRLILSNNIDKIIDEKQVIKIETALINNNAKVVYLRDINNKRIILNPHKYIAIVEI